MRTTYAFVGMLWVALGAVWVVSGEQLIDLAFGMPDIGVADDIIISGVVWIEDKRAALGVPDLFAELRATIHGATGL